MTPMEQYGIDGFPCGSVTVRMDFDEGTKIQMRVSEGYARRILMVLSEPLKPKWEGKE